jgi:methionyl-tRNA synthetase
LNADEKKEVLTDLVKRIRQIGVDLQPFMPETAEKIMAIFGKKEITRGENLFNRLP